MRARKRHHVIVLAAAAMIGTGGAAASAETRYVATALPDGTSPTAINSGGQIVGSWRFGFGEYHAFLYGNGVFKDLFADALATDQSNAYDVNASGQVVGISASVPNNGFLFSGSSVTDLGAPASPNGLNDHADVVGQTGRSAFIYTGGVIQRLVGLGGSLAAAFDINNSGDIVGHSLTTGDAADHGFLRTGDGQWRDLGDFSPVKINDSGDIIGTKGSAPGHGFILSGTNFIDLGNLDGGTIVPEGINGPGDVVGYSSKGFPFTAFLYHAGSLQNLGNLTLGLPIGWRLIDATGINDAGQICALGFDANLSTYRAYLLSPVSVTAGDANGDGTVNGDDYALIDRGMALGLSTWGNGDFDANGVVDAGDYLATDLAFLAEGGHFSPEDLADRASRFGLAYTASLTGAIPEPAGALAAVVAAGCFLRRRT